MSRGSGTILRTTLQHLRHLRLTPGLVSLTVPENTMGEIELPGIAPVRIVAAKLDSADIAWRAHEDGVAVSAHPGRLSLHLLPDA